MRKWPILALSLVSPYKYWAGTCATFSAGGPHLRRIDDPLELGEHRRLGLREEPPRTSRSSCSASTDHARSTAAAAAA